MVLLCAMQCSSPPALPHTNPPRPPLCISYGDTITPHCALDTCATQLPRSLRLLCLGQGRGLRATQQLPTHTEIGKCDDKPMSYAAALHFVRN